MSSYDTGVENLAKEFYNVIQKPSIVAKLLVQNPNILLYQDPYKGNALQAALRTTVANESSALTILNYAESHSMINSYEDNITLCPFYLAIMKGYFNCLAIMVNTKQGKYIIDRYPSLVLISAINNGSTKMISKVLQFPQVSRILNVPYNNEGDTYLHLTVMRKEANLAKSKTIDIVRALISNGANPTIANKQGKRPSLLAKNEQVWNYLRECEVEMEEEYKSSMNDTIHELTQQNDSRESLISRLMTENKSKEFSFSEKVKEAEANTELVRLQLSEEIKQRDEKIEQQIAEIRSLQKEKEDLLATIHLKSEQHITNILNLQQQHNAEKELIHRELETMAKALSELTAGFQQTKTNMIGLQNEALKGFQTQHITRFNNLQQNLQIVQQNQSNFGEKMTELKDNLFHVQQDFDDKINVLKETTDNSIVILKKETKTNRESITQLQQDLEGVVNTMEFNHQSSEFKISETNKKFDGESARVKEHLSSHDNQLISHSDQIGTLSGVVETNRNLTEQRIVINEERIATNSLEIESTNTRLADHTKRQQQDKKKIFEEIEKDRDVQRQTNTRVDQLFEDSSKHSNEILVLKDIGDRRYKEHSEQLNALEETTVSIKDDIVSNKREDKRKFDTLFERVENSEYFQSEKIHEVVIEKMLEEKKRQLEQLEHSLLSNQHFSQ